MIGCTTLKRKINDYLLLYGSTRVDRRYPCTITIKMLSRNCWNFLLESWHHLFFVLEWNNNDFQTCWDITSDWWNCIKQSIKATALKLFCFFFVAENTKHKRKINGHFKSHANACHFAMNLLIRILRKWLVL